MDERWDVIVVGAGGAGMACAIEAAAHGASVVVVEREATVGGTTALGGASLSAAGTRLQRERGIEDTADSHYEDVVRLGGGAADPVLVRLAVDEASATVDWLLELGHELQPDAPSLTSRRASYSAPRVYFARDMRPELLLGALSRAWDMALATGRVTLLLEHELLELLAGGVRVRGRNGARDVSGDAVVLATGGYGGNPQLFSQLTPAVPDPVSSCLPGSDGSGLEAALRAGGQLRNADLYLPSSGAVESAPGSGRALDGWVRFSPSRPPREIYVNARGERFVAEDFDDGNVLDRAVLEQPGARFWLVFDEPALQAGVPFFSAWDVVEIRRRAAVGEQVWLADDVETLARRAGIDAAGLERTVAAWRRAVAGGVDPLGRTDLAFDVATPPFYAALTHPTVIITPGGLVVDGELRVLDAAGAPIPGLYAAGEILGSGATMGTGKVTAMMLTPAVSFGRILGRRLAPAQ